MRGRGGVEEEVLVPEELAVEVGDDALLRLDEVVLHDGGRAARRLVEERVGHLDVVEEEDDGVNDIGEI